MEINNKTMWRIVAIGFTFWLLLALYGTQIVHANQLYATQIIQGNQSDLRFDTITSWFFTALLIIAIIVSIVLIFFPMRFYLYAMIFCLGGLSDLIIGNSITGLLVYLLGCAVVYSNSESKHTLIKYILLIAPLVIVILFRYRLNENVLIETITYLAFLLLFFTLSYFFVIKPFIKKNIKKHLEYADSIDLSGLTAEEILQVKAMVANKTFNASGDNTEKSSADAGKIDLRKLPANELLMLQDVLSHKTLFAIGQDNNLRESTIKRQMSAIYKKLGIYGRSHLLDLHRDEKLIFPE